MVDLLETIVGIVDTRNSCIGGNMGFNQDLQFGKDAEEQILKKVKNKYPLAFMIEGKHKAYDIFVPEINMGIEIKCDRQAEKTGNIFMEIECNHAYSGLLTTTAEWYIYKTTEREFWVKANNIKRYLISEAKQLPMFENTPKGEMSTVRGYLIPIDHFETLSFRVIINE
jgi:hypothetical protein